MDDRVARRTAARRGISVTGTIGILEQAAGSGLLNLRLALQKLLQTNFRIDAEVVRTALERDDSRQKNRPGPKEK